MRETFEAVYENGVLRPLRKIAVSEGQRISLSMEAVSPANDEPGRGYDFSDLAGQLTWRGDPLAEQKRIRDEWS